MTDKTKRIEKVILRCHAFGHSRETVINKLKSMGVTKADMDRYKQYCKERDDETDHTN